MVNKAKRCRVGVLFLMELLSPILCEPSVASRHDYSDFPLDERITKTYRLYNLSTETRQQLSALELLDYDFMLVLYLSNGMSKLGYISCAFEPIHDLQLDNVTEILYCDTIHISPGVDRTVSRKSLLIRRAERIELYYYTVLFDGSALERKSLHLEYHGLVPDLPIQSYDEVKKATASMLGYSIYLLRTKNLIYRIIDDELLFDPAASKDAINAPNSDSRPPLRSAQLLPARYSSYFLQSCQFLFNQHYDDEIIIFKAADNTFDYFYGCEQLHSSAHIRVIPPWLGIDLILFRALSHSPAFATQKLLCLQESLFLEQRTPLLLKFLGLEFRNSTAMQMHVSLLRVELSISPTFHDQHKGLLDSFPMYYSLESLLLSFLTDELGMINMQSFPCLSKLFRAFKAATWTDVLDLILPSEISLFCLIFESLLSPSKESERRMKLLNSQDDRAFSCPFKTCQYQKLDFAHFRDELFNPYRLYDYSVGRYRKLLDEEFSDFTDDELLCEYYRILFGNFMKSIVATFVHPLLPLSVPLKERYIKESPDADVDPVLGPQDVVRASYLNYEILQNEDAPDIYKIQMSMETSVISFSTKFSTHTMSMKDNEHYNAWKLVPYLKFNAGLGLAQVLSICLNDHSDPLDVARKTLSYSMSMLAKGMGSNENDTDTEDSMLNGISSSEFSGLLLGMSLSPFGKFPSLFSEGLLASIFQLSKPLVTISCVASLGLMYLRRHDDKASQVSGSAVTEKEGKVSSLIKLLKLHMLSVIYNSNNQTYSDSGMARINAVIKDLDGLIAQESDVTSPSLSAHSHGPSAQHKSDHLYPSVVLPTPLYSLYSVFTLSCISLGTCDMKIERLIAEETEFLLTLTSTNRWYYKPKGFFEKRGINTGFNGESSCWMGSLNTCGHSRLYSSARSKGSGGYESYLKQNLNTSLPIHLSTCLISMSLLYYRTGHIPPFISSFFLEDEKALKTVPCGILPILASIIIVDSSVFPKILMQEKDEEPFVAFYYQLWNSFCSRSILELDPQDFNNGHKKSIQSVRDETYLYLVNNAEILSQLKISPSGVLAGDPNLSELLGTLNTPDNDGEQMSDAFSYQHDDLLAGILLSGFNNSKSDSFTMTKFYGLLGIFYAFILHLYGPEGTMSSCSVETLDMIALMIKIFKRMTDLMVNFEIFQDTQLGGYKILNRAMNMSKGGQSFGSSITSFFVGPFCSNPGTSASLDSSSDRQYVIMDFEMREFLVYFLQAWSLLLRLITLALMKTTSATSDLNNLGVDRVGNDNWMLGWLAMIRKFWVLGNAYPDSTLLNRGLDMKKVSSFNVLFHLDPSSLSNIGTCICLLLNGFEYQAVSSCANVYLYILLSYAPGLNADFNPCSRGFDDDPLTSFYPLLKSNYLLQLNDPEAHSTSLLGRFQQPDAYSVDDDEALWQDGGALLPRQCRYMWKLLFPSDKPKNHDALMSDKNKAFLPKDKQEQQLIDPQFSLKNMDSKYFPLYVWLALQCRRDESQERHAAINKSTAEIKKTKSHQETAFELILKIISNFN